MLTTTLTALALAATPAATPTPTAAPAPPAAPASPAPTPELTVVPVAGRISMIVGDGGNIGVSAGPDGILIVDDKYAPLSERIRALLRGLDPGPLRFVLNTHWHGDHTGGNAFFAREATLIAHDNVRARLREGSAERKVEPAPVQALPVVTFADGLTVHANGEEVRVRHYPRGHTDGDAVVDFTGSNVVHMGDLFFNRRFPFIDVGSGGSVDGYIAAVAAVLAGLRPGAKVIPGHGPLAGADDLRRFLEMLRSTSAAVAARKAEGATLEQVQREGLAPEWKEWGSGFITTERWIETLYRAGP